MNVDICGGVIVCRQFDAIKSIQHSRKNILTGDSFKPASPTPPPNKSLIQIIIEFLNRRLEP